MNRTQKHHENCKRRRNHACAQGHLLLCQQREEFVAIMGPSGSGKSTLMHILGARRADISNISWMDRMSRTFQRTNSPAYQNKNRLRIPVILFAARAVLRNVALPLIYARPCGTRTPRSTSVARHGTGEERYHHLSTSCQEDRCNA